MKRILLLTAFCCASAFGALTRVELVDRTDVLGGRAFGASGPYEKIFARAYFAVDPKLPENRIVADIGLAPRNEDGLVEFSADLYVLKPRDPAKGNHTALVEISNRGGKGMLEMFDFASGSHDPVSEAEFGDRFLLERGFTLVWVGWEFDVPPDTAAMGPLLRLYAPTATNGGKPITGLVRSEWIGDERVPRISLGDRFLEGYPVADRGDAANRMFVRAAVAGPRRTVPRAEWQFTDETHVSLNGGFTPGLIYEVVYRAKNSVVVGLGPAAVRDLVSFLKYGGPETLLGDQHDRLKRALGFGVSQSARFLRQFLRDGFNADEKNRQVFDGVWAHVGGAGVGGFNMRFGQPSRDGHPFSNVLYPTEMPPFADRELLKNAEAAHVVPKLFLTNGSYEYWGRAASLIHTSEDGERDAEPGRDTRIYFFAGTQHSPGRFPPARHNTQNLGDPADYRYLMRALLVDMETWLADGAAPPESVYPRIAKGELVPLSGLRFPKIPGVRLPAHKREAYRLDFSAEPPKMGAPFPTLVPQVDADGIDLGGIRLPEVAVPLATYTGWNLRDPKIGAPEEIYSMVGSWIPFARPRYASREDYLRRIAAASTKLVNARFLLEADTPAIGERAASEWDHVLPSK